MGCHNQQKILCYKRQILRSRPQSLVVTQKRRKKNNAFNSFVVVEKPAATTVKQCFVFCLSLSLFRYVEQQQCATLLGCYCIQGVVQQIFSCLLPCFLCFAECKKSQFITLAPGKPRKTSHTTILTLVNQCSIFYYQLAIRAKDIFEFRKSSLKNCRGDYSSHFVELNQWVSSSSAELFQVKLTIKVYSIFFYCVK